MKITQEVRQFAEQAGLDEADALTAGMKNQAETFKKLGGELYVPASDAS